MAGRQPINGDCRVLDIVQRFVDYHQANSARGTYEFSFRPLESFLSTLAANMRVCDLRSYHVTQWIDGRKAAKRRRKVGDKYIIEESGKPGRSEGGAWAPRRHGTECGNGGPRGAEGGKTVLYEHRAELAERPPGPELLGLDIDSPAGRYNNIPIPHTVLLPRPKRRRPGP
jgi:hypothetical protein